MTKQFNCLYSISRSGLQALYLYLYRPHCYSLHRAEPLFCIKAMIERKNLQNGRYYEAKGSVIITPSEGITPIGKEALAST